jgi:MFS family permease
LSALTSGLVFTILAAAYFVASLRAPALVARRGPRVVVGGALVLAAGHVASLVAVDTGSGSVAALAPGLLLVGTGMGLCLAPLTGIVLAQVEPQRAGEVSGLLSTTQQVGNAIGVAAVGLLFFHYADGAGAAGVTRGFEWSSLALAALLGCVAAGARRLA